MKKVAINGLGRIGRLLLRGWLERQPRPFQIVAANDLVDAENLAYLLKFDSVHGRMQRPPSVDGEALVFGDDRIALFHEADPAQLPWGELGVDVVIECTGRFTSREKAMKHVAAGARKVLISAPADDADLTLVMGVNQDAYDSARHTIVSNASCTTNSLLPPLKVLLDEYGIDHAMITTVHAYTASQSTVDAPSRKHIRGRAGAMNIIPTSTGADKAAIQVIPELKGKLAATALRVPVPDGAITDIAVQLSKPATAAQINQSFKAASEGRLAGILAYSDEEIVSSDILGDAHSAIVHGLSTRVIQERVARVQVWYDNEFGYSSRLVDAAAIL
jgi:glyceraldehyde-3-phosphate dehydrogenase type I